MICRVRRRDVRRFLSEDDYAAATPQLPHELRSQMRLRAMRLYALLLIIDGCSACKILRLYAGTLRERRVCCAALH